MTKQDIVSRIIEQTGVEKATVLAVVEKFYGTGQECFDRWGECLSQRL